MALDSCDRLRRNEAGPSRSPTRLQGEQLVAFRNELISIADRRGLVFGNFRVEIRGGGSEPFRRPMACVKG